MAEMVLTPSQSEGKEANFIQKFGRAFIHGDVFTKLSLVVWGFGYIGHPGTEKVRHARHCADGNAV